MVSLNEKITLCVSKFETAVDVAVLLYYRYFKSTSWRHNLLWSLQNFKFADEQTVKLINENQITLTKSSA